MELLTVHDAAELLSVSEETVRRYCNAGKISGASRLADRGPWRMTVASVVSLAGGNTGRVRIESNHNTTMTPDALGKALTQSIRKGR
jgi:predicted DNA-binding transcriptional regulator YafY